MNLGYNSNTLQIFNFTQGTKSTKAFKFTSKQTNPNISVALCQNKLQTNSVFANTIDMSSTERCPSSLIFDLKNYTVLKELIVKIQFFSKDKKNAKPEEKKDPKSFIALEVDHQDFEFPLETAKEHSFAFECTNTNKPNKCPFYKLRASFYESKYAEEPDFIFESPYIIVHSKMDSPEAQIKKKEKKRKLTQVEEQPSKIQKTSQQYIEQLTLDELHGLLENIKNQIKKKQEEEYEQMILKELQELNENTFPDFLLTFEDEVPLY